MCLESGISGGLFCGPPVSQCPYRSNHWTGTSILGVISLVSVPLMDLYEHWFIGVQSGLEHCFIDSADRFIGIDKTF